MLIIFQRNHKGICLVEVKISEIKKEVNCEISELLRDGQVYLGIVIILLPLPAPAFSCPPSPDSQNLDLCHPRDVDCTSAAGKHPLNQSEHSVPQLGVIEPVLGRWPQLPQNFSLECWVKDNLFSLQIQMIKIKLRELLAAISGPETEVLPK